VQVSQPGIVTAYAQMAAKDATSSACGAAQIVCPTGGRQAALSIKAGNSAIRPAHSRVAATTDVTKLTELGPSGARGWLSLHTDTGPRKRARKTMSCGSTHRRLVDRMSPTG
jgi:hypothetical protein